MSQETIAILILVNVLAALFLIGWYLFDKTTKRILKSIEESQKQTHITIAQNQHKLTQHKLKV